MRNGRIMRLLLLGSALGLCSVTRAETVSEEERLQFADGLHARGMHALAIEEYRAYLRESPGSERSDAAHFRLGESYRLSGHKSEAERQFKEVFEKYPSSEFRARAGFRRADLFMEGGKYAEALDLFEKVLKADPPPEIAGASLYFMGDALIRLGKPKRAGEVLRRFETEYATSEFRDYALLKLAQVYGEGSDEGEEERVTALYERVAANPSSERVAAEALFQLGGLQFRAKSYAASAETYRHLLTKYPEDERAGEALLPSTWAAHNAGLYTEALEDSTKALKSKATADRAEWLYLKANCERQLLRNGDSAATYRKLLSGYEDSAFANAARYELAVALYRMGSYEEAVEEANRVERTAELTLDVTWLLAEAYAAMGDDAAVQYYRLIVKEFADRPVACEAAYRLGYHLQTRGKFAEAMRNYRLAAEQCPTNALAPASLYAAAYCAAKIGEHTGAIRDWGKLIDAHPESPRIEEALYQRAMSQIRLGRDEGALASLRMLLDRFPVSAVGVEARFWLGMVLKNVGEMEDAEAEFRQCLKAGPRLEIERDAQFNLGVVLQRLKRPDEAAALLGPLLATPVRDKFTPVLLEWLAEHDFENRREDSLVAARLLTATEGDPALVQMGWSLLAADHLEKGRLDEARDAFEEALATGAETRRGAEAALRLGEIALEQKEPTRSRSWFAEAAGRARDDALLDIRAQAYAGMGRALKAKKDFLEAAKHFMSVAVLYEDPVLVPECLYEAVQAFARAGRTEERDRAAAELRERYPASDWTRLLKGPALGETGASAEGDETP